MGEDGKHWNVTQTFHIDGKFDGTWPEGSIRFGNQITAFDTLDEAVAFVRAREDEFTRATGQGRG